MVLIFTEQEAIELHNIMESAEPGSVETFKELTNNNKIVQFRTNIVSKALEVTIDKSYSVEFLHAYARFVGLFVSQAKALIATIESFTVESQAIAEKHM
jgi:hypothetical protein